LTGDLQWQRCQSERSGWDFPIFPMKTIRDEAQKRRNQLKKEALDALQPDSAVTMYWEPKMLAAATTDKQPSRVVGFAYGLGSVSGSGRLALSVAGKFVPGGEFTLTCLVNEPKEGETVTLTLPEGFSLSEGASTQKVPAVEAGATRKISTVTWKIKAGSPGRHELSVKSSVSPDPAKRQVIITKPAGTPGVFD
jgi:hypothetical protein